MASNSHILVVSCAEDVRKLIATERYLKKALKQLTTSMVDIDTFTSRRDADRWAALGADYAAVVEESEHTAVKLASLMKVYISLPQGIADEHTDGMAAELDTLKTQISAYDFDRHTELAELMARAERLRQEQSQAVDARRTSAADEVQRSSREVDACTVELQKLNHQHAAAREAVPKESRISSLSDLLSRRSNSLPLSLPAAGSTRSAEEGQRRKRSLSHRPSDVHAERTPQSKSNRGLEGQIEATRQALARCQRRLTDAQETANLLDVAEWQSTYRTMKAFITHLGKQDKQLSALAEIRRQFLNEISAYLLALHGLRAYPGQKRKAALRSMQERVESTASVWQAVAELLTNEYAKGRK